ncbi:MAG: aminotransferase class IV, partial [Deltaproteobacteria bacterium]|nr:aminotransferase class IV [Deltaproteobacteria bacterium]
ILPGITRDIIRDLCEGIKIPFRDELVSEKDLSKAEEMFLSGTSMEVTPVIRVDDWKVGKGAPGPVTSRLQDAYKNMLAEFMRS